MAFHYQSVTKWIARWTVVVWSATGASSPRAPAPGDFRSRRSLRNRPERRYEGPPGDRRTWMAFDDAKLQADIRAFNERGQQGPDPLASRHAERRAAYSLFARQMA